METINIAIAPHSSPVLSSAIESACCSVVGLDNEPDGLVWLDPSAPDDLRQAISAAPTLRWVQLPFAGVDAFSALFREFPQINWTSAKGVYASPVAEHALALTLALLRDLPMRIRAKTWGKASGRTLHGAHTCIVGGGGIGAELTRLFKTFDADVTIVRASPKAVPLADSVIDDISFRHDLNKYDVIVLACALTRSTHHLLGRQEFESMAQNAIVVNVGRGPLIDTPALVSALEANQLAGAALDVSEPEPLPSGSPLWSMQNVIITPHTASPASLSQPLLAHRVKTNAKAFAEGREMIGTVDTAAGY